MNFDRREFLISMSAAIAALSTRSFAQSQDPSTGALVVGQGNYQWKAVPGWGVLDAETPVKDCHAMVQTKDGRIFLFNNHTKNNMVIYDRAGKLLGKWGTEYPGAHGMTLAVENGEEVLYLTDHDRHQVYKTTLDGKVLRTWDYPEKSGKYKSAGEYKPTHVALAPDGGFFVVDGYGKSWCHRYDKNGEWVKCFGGNDPNGANLVCSHGAWVDTRDPKNLLWITSRSESKLKRYTLDGELVDVLELTGAEPNFIVPYGDHTVIPCLRSTGHQNGLLCVLDPSRKVISNLAAAPPKYEGEKLATITSDTKLFTYPHGILIDDEKSIYVAQWNSGKTYPIKLERVKA